MEKKRDAPMYPVLHPDAAVRDRKLHARIRHFAADDAPDASFGTAAPLIFAAMTTSFLAGTGVVLANNPVLVALTAALAVLAVGFCALAGEEVADALALRAASQRLEFVVQQRDFRVGGINSRLLAAQASGELPLHPAAAREFLVSHDLPGRIAAWSDDVRKLGDRADVALVCRSAFLARDVFDNEMRRAQLALDGDVGAAQQLSEHIASQRDTLTRLEVRLAGGLAEMRDEERNRKLCAMQARQELGGAQPEIAGLATQQLVEAQLDLL